MSKFKQVFIVGLHRAGTSYMFRLCNSVLDYPGQIESHVWPSFKALVDEVEASTKRLGGRQSRAYQNFLIGQWGADRIKEQVFNLFNAQYTNRFGERWVDKTPGQEMVRTVPLMARRFPDAGFIFMRRRPVENLQSRFRRFNNRDIATACREWTQTMNAWLNVRDKVGDRAIELDQQQMALAPRQTAARLRDFFELSPEESDAVTNFLLTARTEQTQVPLSRPITLDQTGWRDNEKKMVRERCGPIAAQFGYQLDATEFEFEVEPGRLTHFNFTANATGVTVHSPSGKTHFNPNGLMLASTGAEEYVEVSSISFDGENRMVARVKDGTNLSAVKLQITLPDGSHVESAFTASADGSVSAELPALHGAAVIRLSIRPGAGKPRQLALLAPYFEQA